MTELIIRFVATVIVVIVLMIILSRFRKTDKQVDSRDSLIIMKERLEKGEITAEEYEEAKKRRGK